MTTETDQDLIIRWAWAEYALRTRALENGSTNIDWLDPDSRVTITEILSKADQVGLKIDPIELRRVLYTRKRK